jgi:hypothetical protein
VGLEFERFTGKPDGGVGWVKERLPFVFLEIGVSDTKTKTVKRIND